MDLSPAERLQICYLSFPDSNNSCTRDTSYHFRIRRTSTPPRSPRSSKFESQIPVPMTSCGDYFFGFVHFRQQKDVSIPRGYFQKVSFLDISKRCLSYALLQQAFSECCYSDENSTNRLISSYRGQNCLQLF